MYKKRMLKLAAVVLVCLAAFLPLASLAAPEWVPSTGGSFYLKVNSPESGIVVGAGEPVRLRFEVKGNNPNEKFALFMTPAYITSYYNVSADNILAEYTGLKIQYDSNQFADSSGFYIDFNMNLGPGQYHLWVQYYNGSNVAQSAHTPISVRVAEPAEWKVNGDNWRLYRNGSALTGLQYSRGNHYYLGSNGIMARGWQPVNGQWRYFDSAGIMQVGWVKDAGKWYFVDASGAMRAGWIQINRDWYLLGGSGDMKTGWQFSGGNWYYMDGNGIMRTGWVQSGGKWYYLNGSGVMLAGWRSIGGQWYYFDGGGAMKTGWHYTGGSWYYMNGSGAMLTGTHNIGGTAYTFNSSGVWIS